MSTPEKETQALLAEVPRQLATSSTASVFSNMQAFGDAQRMAQLLASCDLVPSAYVNNVANCTIAIEMAQRMNASPLAIMQNLHVIHGRPSWAAVFIIASLNTSGNFSPLRYKFSGEGDTRSCFAWAIDIKDGERLEGPLVTWKMAMAEGWVQKKGSKWQTMPDVMFMYRAASFFGKLYSPELLMGMSSAEEMGDIIDLEPQGNGEYVPSAKGAEGVKDKLKQNLQTNHPSDAKKPNEHIDTSTGEVAQEEPSANDKLKDKLKTKTQAKEQTSNAKNSDADQF